MCGRFTQRYTWPEIHDLYGLTGAARNLQAHYNIAPTDTVEVIRPAVGGPELVPMRWGLIPYWWKKPVKQLPATFNARAEGVADKPMFRDAFKRHRCIIPASGYYEWIKRRDGKNLETGEPVASCTIIVTDANALTRTIHDRMPVLLDKADFEPWLSGAEGAEFLRSAAGDRVGMWPVSRRVNKTGSGGDDPTLIDEVAEGLGRGFALLAPLAPRLFERGMRANLAMLKQLLELGSTPQWRLAVTPRVDSDNLGMSDDNKGDRRATPRRDHHRSCRP